LSQIDYSTIFISLISFCPWYRDI